MSSKNLTGNPALAKVTSHWKKVKNIHRKQTAALLQGIALLDKNRPTRIHSDTVFEQPFDSHLLAWSPLYRRNRATYLKKKGVFRPSFISSPRTLSSFNLLFNKIDYSPIESEILWAAQDPIQKKNPQYLLTLRSFTSNLFHEQSHRNLMGFLPAPPRDFRVFSKYLNFVESLVIVLDMALSDELGPALASLFHHIGVIYDPGTDIRETAKSQRDYRNYLQAALYATYLNLELYSQKDVLKATHALFPHLGELAERAALRSTRLDREFVVRTNPIWQRKHSVQALKLLEAPNKEPLQLPQDPLDNRLLYLWTEKWLEKMGL